MKKKGKRRITFSSLVMALIYRNVKYILCTWQDYYRNQVSSPPTLSYKKSKPWAKFFFSVSNIVTLSLPPPPPEPPSSFCLVLNVVLPPDQKCFFTTIYTSLNSVSAFIE